MPRKERPDLSLFLDILKTLEEIQALCVAYPPAACLPQWVSDRSLADFCIFGNLTPKLPI